MDPIAMPSIARPPCEAYALKYSDVSTDVAQLSYEYISAVLDEHRVNGSYGALIVVTEGGHFAPAVRFGIPGGGQLRLTPPRHFPIRVFVVDDQLITAASKQVLELRDSGSLGIGQLSIGVEDNVEEAGSFGCFLSDSEGRQYGLTAAHVLGNGPSSDNTKVVSPSSQEITAYMRGIIRYTSFCPPVDRLHINPVKEQEAQNIFAKYATILSPTHGIEIMRAANCPTERVIFCGREEGNIVFSAFTQEPGAIAKHNTYLLERNLPLMHMPAEAAHLSTRKDIALFDLK